MTNGIEKSAALAVLFLSVVLSGCETTGAAYPAVNWAGSKSAYVLFEAPAFKGAESKHVVFTDRWQHEEYVLFEGQGAQAEIIYSAANERDTIALDYSYPVVPMVMTWNIAKRHPIVWGEEGQTGAPLGAYFYRHFRLTDVGRECVGFFVEWDLKDEDPQLRNGKVLFGYYCERPGAPLSRNGVFTLLDNIWIRGLNTRLDHRFQPVAPTGGPLAGRQGALNFAKFGAGDTGNAKFPFDMAAHFNIADGDPRFDR